MAVPVPTVAGPWRGVTMAWQCDQADIRKPGISNSGDGNKTHLLGDGADLLSGQVVEGENEPPVKVAFASQGPVVHVCLLLVFFKP